MTTVAEIEVIAELDTRQIVAGMDTIKRKTTELGQHHDRALGGMSLSWRQLNRAINDVTLIVGRITFAFAIAKIAIDAFGAAFGDVAEIAKKSLDDVKKDLDDVEKKLEKQKMERLSYARQEELIKAKYAPDSKEYKEAMLGLQEQMATEEFMKSGDKSALGEIATVQTQKDRLTIGSLSLQEQYDLAHAPSLGAADTYNYGMSASYLKAANLGIASTEQDIQGLKQAEEWYGYQPVPGTPGMGTAAPERRLPELEEIKKHLDTLAKEPRTVNITIETLNSIDAPLTVASKIGEAAAMGYSTANIKAR